MAYYRERDQVVARAAEALGSTEGEMLNTLMKLQDKVGNLEAER